ncbi:MAG TPA: pitrilysin family protein [Vicinamibacterales bacterium]|jgi:zinc protease|nr:pitrilysin family protein [Vicinamibacterales bacterium]
MAVPETLAHSPVRTFHLDNGLRILVKELHTAPLVSVWCWYRVGSGDEAPGRTGVSHWVEHMNFKGTAHIPRDEMKSIVERFGGAWNGYTWIDQTTYLETAGSDALDTLLFIEAERMAYGLYEPDDCESERTVIISELQGGDNDPDQLLDTEVTASAFRAHPYRHPTIGWIDDLRSMTRDDLVGHYKRHYVPGNATLVVVGAVDTDDVVKRAEAHFGRIAPSAPPSRDRPAEPQQIGERRVLVEREGTTAYLKCAWHAPDVNDTDFYPMLVLDAALTGAKGLNIWTSFRGAPPQRTARLYTALVERGLASVVSGSLLPTSQPFLYNVSLTATDGVPLAALEDAALAEIERVRKHGLTEPEVARAKRQLRARLVFENDSVTNVAHQLGYFETVAGAGYFDTIGSRVQAVTAAQVADVASRRLAADKRTVGWFRPVRSGA